MSRDCINQTAFSLRGVTQFLTLHEFSGRSISEHFSHVLLPWRADDLADDGRGHIGDVQNMLPIRMLAKAYPLSLEGECVLWELGPHLFEWLILVLIRPFAWDQRGTATIHLAANASSIRSPHFYDLLIVVLQPVRHWAVQRFQAWTACGGPHQLHSVPPHF